MIGSALQKGIVAALKASPAIAAGRIYDRVPATPTFPYVTVGDEQLLDAGNSCEDGWEAFSDVHLWSRPATGSKAEVKDLAGDVVARLATDTLIVTGFTTIIAALESMRTFRDQDGITEHTVVTIRHVLQPA